MPITLSLFSSGNWLVSGLEKCVKPTRLPFQRRHGLAQMALNGKLAKSLTLPQRIPRPNLKCPESSFGTFCQPKCSVYEITRLIVHSPASFSAECAKLHAKSQGSANNLIEFDENESGYG
jgi:hypothetical protein